MAIVTKDNVSRKARDFYEKGFAAVERGNFDYAMEMILHALELEPGFFEARKLLQAAAVRKFKTSNGGAITHLTTTLSGFIPAMVARTKIGKKPLDALHEAEKLISKDPYNPLFVYLMCDAAEALGMPEVAVQAMEILRDHRPNDNKLLLRLAKAYVGNQQAQQGSAIYQELLNKRPNDQQLIKLYKDATAISTMDQGGWGESKSYRDLIKDTREAETLEQAQKAVKTTSDIESLIQETLGKLEREPGNINYKRALADLYARNKQLAEAITVMEEAQQSTGGGDPQIDRVLSDLRLRQMEEKLAGLQAAGDAAAAAAQEQAIADYKLADAQDRVRRYPNDLEFKYELGEMLYARGDFNEAIQQFQAAQKSPKRRISALFHLAMCFKEKGQFDIAREQLMKAAEELPVMDELKKDVLYELGGLCESTDQKAEAIRYYKEIYAVDIGYKDVAQKIESAYG